MAEAAVHAGKASAERRLEVVDPWSGSVVDTVATADAADVDRAIDRGRARQSLPPERRAELLLVAAERVGARAEEFARSITSEAGTCIKESAKEVERARGNLVAAAEEAKRIRGETLQVPGTGGLRMAATVREPVGMVAAITPFNRPLNQVVVKVAPAVAAGNGIVVKPSEKTPLTALLFADLLLECGLPEDTMSVVVGEPEEVGAALAEGAVDMVTFTGGTTAGRAIARAAAGKRVTLEMGGNDPLIVLDDGDLRIAARIAATQAFATAGQSCRGVKRVIAIDAVADELAERIAAHAAEICCGNPLDPGTDIGPLIDEGAAARVERRCADAVRAGATVVHGGERDGALHPATVLDHVSADVELVVEETFGPVAPVIRVHSDRHAIEVANSTEYGLQAGVITESYSRFADIVRQLDVGAVNLMEGPAFDSPHIPFGGVKGSGIGREGIRWAIEEMTRIKTITLPCSSP
jgi:acyl-CoA reductase-like NAD-dependent aldehyde dehydrogenase